MANEVLFWQGDKVHALAAGRKLVMDGVRGFVAGTATLTNDGTNVAAADTVTVDQNVYTFVTALTEVAASAVLTNNGTNVADGDTVTINGVVYTFQETLTNVAGNVHIGGSNTASMTNLYHAINASGGTSGTDYAAACVANPAVTATNPSGTTVDVTAKSVGHLGNDIQVSTTSADLSWPNGVNDALTGGVDSVANEVVVGGSNTASMTHLYEAINAGSNVGVDYSTATIAHPSVTATNPSGTTVVVTAIGTAQDGDSQNTIATLETSAHLSWNAATITGGVDADNIVDPMTGFPAYAAYNLTTGANAEAYTLPAGDEGQEITILFGTKGGGNAVVAGAFVGGTHLTLSAANQVAKLQFFGASWVPLVNTGAIA